ncbi:MAG: PIN domain-containing protein [Candidatus Marinimicrobia bacterium]|nr:PIN domain-containing protein [Candidatus Neomarinimicrobiota bacterium]MCH7762832.1 PIN domain-containing protein [Candidatus Neomarinimicrobiota bacterium]
MNSDLCFLDTNVLVYAFDKSAGDKQDKARSLVSVCIRNGSGNLSTQVLQEFYVVATRKLNIIPEMVKSVITSFYSLDIVSITPAIILDAIDTELRWEVSFWDALILQSAMVTNCSILYTEDLNHEQMYGNIQVINPFL